MITIGFSSSNKILAKIIKWVTNSQWSHCFIVLGELDGLTIIGEAKFPYVRMMPLSMVMDHYEILEIEDINPEDTHEAKKKIIALTTKRYGLFQLLGYSWKLITGKTNPFTDDYVCSEYVALFLQRAGVISPLLNPNDLSPADVYYILKTKIGASDHSKASQLNQ